MGQQQLLLLVLGIVIVGIAILVGINAYSENSVKSNWDSLLQDALRIASDSQAWKSKPELFGGSPDSTKTVASDFNNLDFLDLAYAAARISDGTGTNSCYSNLNGDYDLDGDAAGLTIIGANVPNQNQITVTVNGTLESNVALDESGSVKGGESLSTSGGTTPVSSPCST